eukprot:SAG22_NODE_1887_length_3375_cov_1.948413_2_plen_213_part_00
MPSVNLLISNVTLAFTGWPWGTPPMAGLDLEPDQPVQAMTNVTVQDVRSIGNRGGGFNMYLRRSDATSPPVSVAFRNCTVSGAGGAGISIGAMSPGMGAGGTGVLVDGCSVRNTTSWGMAVFDKAATGPPVVVRNSAFADVATNATMVSPCPPNYRPWKCSADRCVGDVCEEGQQKSNRQTMQCHPTGHALLCCRPTAVLSFCWCIYCTCST